LLERAARSDSCKKLQKGSLRRSGPLPGGYTELPAGVAHAATRLRVAPGSVMERNEPTSARVRRHFRGSGVPGSLLGRFGRAALGRRRILWIALAVVVLPLVVLLSLQYRLLVDLQRNTAVAHRVALEIRIDLLARQVALHFSTTGERMLRVPPWAFTPACDCFDKFVFEHFPPAGSSHGDPVALESSLTAPEQGVRYFFLVPLVGRFQGRVQAYDLRKRVRIDEGSIAPSTRLVLSYSQMRAQKTPASIDPKDVIADESDPGHPMLLGFVADEKSQLVGIAAVVVDLDFFTRETLPTLLRRALHTEGTPPEFVVTVWDAFDKEIFADPGTVAPHFEVKRQLGSVLGKWTIALGSRRSTGAEIARANFMVNVTLSAILASVLLAGIVLVMRTAAREMKLSEIKSDFVSNVSHELRTPLSSIRVFGELMRLGRVNDSAKVREYGEYIESEGRRLSQLIDNILDFSRIESGGKLYQLKEHDVAEVVRDVLQAFAPRLQREGFVVDLTAPRDPLPPVRIDEAAIGHALGNLLDNAIKYSGASRRISVTLAVDSGELVVALRDFGIGIAREEHERIFDRFHRVGRGLVHDVKGSGLGLAIVKHIADAHSGSVTVDSSPGHGSVFALRLPLAGGDGMSRPAASG
jgi:signal transduction histidine kinase